MNYIVAKIMAEHGVTEEAAYMIQAERREGDFMPNCHFLTDEPASIAVQVADKMDFDEACKGEIDPVEEDHYLAGPNFMDFENPDFYPYAEELAYYGGNV